MAERHPPGSSRPGKSSVPYSNGRKSIPRDLSYFGSIFISLLLTMTLEKGKATHSRILAWKIPWGCKESDMTERLSLHTMIGPAPENMVQ